MFFYVAKRNTILKIALVVALVAASVVITLTQTQSQSAFADQKRELPIYSVQTDSKKIAISFDAAWGDEKTEGILEILAQRNIKTTFFLVGFWVDRYPEKVQLIHDAGHEIGNHSTNHPHMTQLSREQMIQELDTTAAKIEKITQYTPTLFRPPYGDYNNEVIKTCRENGYEVIQWSVDSLDWKELGVDNMVQQVTGKVQDGSIVLFHNNSKHILEALPVILDTLIAQGYEIVSVSQLIYHENFVIDHTGCQKPAAQ